MIEKHLLAHKITLSDLVVSLELGTTEAIKTAVEQGMGVSIVSWWAVKKEVSQGSIKATAFKDLRFLREFSVLYPKRKSPPNTGGQFLDFLKFYVGKDGPA
jgi:LysR family transcriptional regulator, transcriptional activator of the cysJI operon